MIIECDKKRKEKKKEKGADICDNFGEERWA